MGKVLPILFNTDMVRAILDGRKTVTRRLVKHDSEKMNMCNCKIYDNEEKEWLKLLFVSFKDAEDYVIYVLCDADFERYSIYNLMRGKY